MPQTTPPEPDGISSLDSFEAFQSALRHAEEAKMSWYAAFLNLRQTCIELRVESFSRRVEVSELRRTVENLTNSLLHAEQELAILAKKSIAPMEDK